MRELLLPEECLGYGLVVPFPAYGFAALVPHNESLNSLNSYLNSTLQFGIPKTHRTGLRLPVTLVVNLG